MKRSPVIAFGILGIVAAVFLPFVLVLLHPSLAGFIHRQTAYGSISEEVTEGCSTDLERTMAVMAYVHLHEAHLSDWTLARDRDVLHDLVRNVGWCDQQSNAMAHLLLPLGIDARMVMFPCHTFAEVIVHGRPLLFDPTYNSYFLDRYQPDSIAGLDDLLTDPQAIVTRHGQDMAGYEQRDILTCGRHRSWTLLSSSMTGGRGLLSYILGLFHSIGGKPYSNALNRWYLFVRHHGDSMLRARCLHLFGERAEAQRIYAADGSLPAQFFLFQALVETGQYERAAEVLEQFTQIAAAQVAHNVEDAYCTEVMKDYTVKLRSLSGSELKRLFKLDDDGLQNLFRFLDTLE
ncbi:MAG: transglutaminase-like domain-containing protein [Flavobacteriales bacterium]|nr:transglutaminase-like domain-containing protein [Flavobacteriales bacterium]